MNEGGYAIEKTYFLQPTPIAGIHYYLAPENVSIDGLDGRVHIPCGGLALPILEDEISSLAGDILPYDAVGRGIYHVLRFNPDCVYGERYAHILKEGYPHYLSELASHILMLGQKDVEISYLDRRINYLKVFALIEPGNFQFPLEIGMTFLDKGLRLSALQLSTVNLYRAEDFLRKALKMSPDSVQVRHQLGEVCYLLGKYQDVDLFWSDILAELPGDEQQKLKRRLDKISEGVHPRIPVVDYLAAVGAAFELHQQGEYAESAAILKDVLDDQFFTQEFPLPEIYYMLGLCYRQLAMPKDAEEYLRKALVLNPDYSEACRELDKLYS